VSPHFGLDRNSPLIIIQGGRHIQQVAREVFAVLHEAQAAATSVAPSLRKTALL
jgi:hypothetical protein